MYCSVVGSVLTQVILVYRLSVHGLQLGGVGDEQGAHCLYRSKIHKLKHGTDLVFADMKPPVAEPSESGLAKLQPLSSSLSLSLLPLRPSFFSIIRLLPTSLSLISFLPPYLPRFSFPPPYSSYLHCTMYIFPMVTYIDVRCVISHPSSPM